LEKELLMQLEKGEQTTRKGNVAEKIRTTCRSINIDGLVMERKY
jgi:hypothetical protein